MLKIELQPQKLQHLGIFRSNLTKSSVKFMNMHTETRLLSPSMSAMTSDKENSSKILILEEMADSKIHIALNVGHQFFS